MSLVVVGDALLDRDLDGRAERLAPDAPVPVVDAIQERPRPGGAGLAAALAAATREDVTLICALGDDDAGARLMSLLEAAGVQVHDLGLRGPTPEKVRVRAGGRPIVRLDSGRDAAGCGRLTVAARRALHGADAVLVSDYGGGVAAAPSVRRELAALLAPIVWDPHPKGGEPIPGVILATPNATEAGGAASLPAAEAAARVLAARWRAANVCVTRGRDGAVLVGGEGPALAIPAPPVAAGDPCGAGDAFSATASVRLARGALPPEAVEAAVRAASAFVAAGGASEAGFDVPPAVAASATARAEQARREGRTVVATGGCFDLLHAGHVRMLEAARALGDCLIVCLNSDTSVRRLKGADRPVVGEEDRSAVLAALGCVDAVAMFDEDDPRAILRELRPDVWVKGGDYAVGELPEAEVLAGWGGAAVIVPYVSGRSTTRLIEEAVLRAR
jgi:D-beta-D-heptose 7-phosphate kinase/D-beta-D-heptose 1-phosphate adenosyltransferase